MEKGRKVDFRMDMWMFRAIEGERKKRGLSLTDMINKLLRQELEYLGHTEGKYEADLYHIGREAAENQGEPKAFDKASGQDNL
jgi:hypothetical protein